MQAAAVHQDHPVARGAPAPAAGVGLAGGGAATATAAAAGGERQGRPPWLLGQGAGLGLAGAPAAAVGAFRRGQRRRSGFSRRGSGGGRGFSAGQQRRRWRSFSDRGGARRGDGRIFCAGAWSKAPGAFSKSTWPSVDSIDL